MKITIDINTDSAAWEDFGIKEELHRELESAQTGIVNLLSDYSPIEANFKLLDSNGNATGTVRITRE